MLINICCFSPANMPFLTGSLAENIEELKRFFFLFYTNLIHRVCACSKGDHRCFMLSILVCQPKRQANQGSSAAPRPPRSYATSFSDVLQDAVFTNYIWVFSRGE